MRVQAARAAHKLAGSAGTFGFSVASEHARGLELALEAPGGLVTTELPRLADLVAVLRSELEAPAPAPAPAAVPAAAPSPVLPSDVLVVGADPVRTRALGDEARTRRLQVRAVADVASARAALASTSARLVVLDLAGPDEPDAALEFLTERAAEGPVVVLTDPLERVDAVEVARRGGRGFLPHDTGGHDVIDFLVTLLEGLRAHGTTILALDDDPAVLGAVGAVLGAAGLDVYQCDDPRELWSQLDRVEPDLLLLDVEMPHATGPELCRAIRNDRRWTGLPVVFLTARDDPDTVREIFAAGADDFVPKAFVGPELLARIANRLERVRLYRSLADTDGLTGLANRRRAVEAIDALRRLAARMAQPLSVAVLDVDRFKAINDRHGHATGDLALRGVASALTQAFRGEDIVARWGGDEFVVAMYGLTSEAGRQRLGEVLEDMRRRTFGPAGRTVGLTLTAGIAEFPRDGVSLDELYRAADHALYAAKAAGGDRVIPAGQEPACAPGSVDVVLVEDDPVLGELLEHALATRGYRTRWITDGVQAVALLGGDAPAPALVLLDWDLPGLDGLRVLRSLAAGGRLAHTRVIMLTARATESEILQALEAGAIDHVAKPFSVPVLIQRVRRAMER
jgi:diguanylate cyclase (GGDEF)-like protein